MVYLVLSFAKVKTLRATIRPEASFALSMHKGVIGVSEVSEGRPGRRHTKGYVGSQNPESLFLLSTAALSDPTVRYGLLETSLWKLSTGFWPSFSEDIGNWLAGSEVQFPTRIPTMLRRRRRREIFLFFGH